MRRTTQTVTHLHAYGHHVKASGQSWSALWTDLWEQLSVEARVAGATITLSRAPRSRRRWLLHRDQVMVGTVYRRWDGTWDGLDHEERCLISHAATRQDAVNALLAAEHGK